MSFLNRIFGSSDEQNETKFWNQIESEQDLINAVEKSFEKKVAIFKHSTRCYISKSVLRNFENQVQNSHKNAEYYFLDLLSHRDLSNKIAEDFGITHQSPQLIVLENGKAINNSSHENIDIELVKD